MWPEASVLNLVSYAFTLIISVFAYSSALHKHKPTQFYNCFYLSLPLQSHILYLRPSRVIFPCNGFFWWPNNIKWMKLNYSNF